MTKTRNALLGALMRWRTMGKKGKITTAVIAVLAVAAAATGQEEIAQALVELMAYAGG